MQSDEVGALELDQQSLAAHRAAGDRRNEAIAHGNIGAGWLGLGELARARRELEEGLRLLRVNGERALEVSPLCALSTLALWQGDDARALVQARAALETAVAVQARDQESLPGAGSATPNWRLGGIAAAAQAFASAHARASEIASPYRHDASAGLARVALAQGDTAAAMQALAPLLALGAMAGADGTRSKAWNSRAWSSGPAIGCWRVRVIAATPAPPSGWPARTTRFRPRRRPSPTPRFARASFATSRSTARSWRRGMQPRAAQPR